jgi:hypothetical protein
LLNLKTVQDFISKEDAEEIIYFVSKIEKWEDSEGTSFWSNRCLSAQNIYNNYNKDMGKYLYDLRSRIEENIKSHYGLDEVFPDLLQVIRWFPGMEQAPHSDNMKNTEHSAVHQHRDYGAVLYLNDNFSGGKTFYPQYDFEISPEAGKLAIHPAETDHMHGVTKVEDGVRYTIVSFWTKDKAHFDNWIVTN